MSFSACFLHYVSDLDAVRWAVMSYLKLCLIKCVLYVRSYLKCWTYSLLIRFGKHLVLEIATKSLN